MSDRSSEEELLEFLYACPVGLIECDSDPGRTDFKLVIPLP